jgi:hypothetical protein
MGLPSGDYTLCVRILHDDGTMDDEINELDIEILSPWYRSWWAWILYALLIGLLIFNREKIVRAVKAFGKRNLQHQKKSDDEPSVTSDNEKEEEIEEAILMDE